MVSISDRGDQYLNCFELFILFKQLNASFCLPVPNFGPHGYRLRMIMRQLPSNSTFSSCLHRSRLGKIKRQSGFYSIGDTTNQLLMQGLLGYSGLDKNDALWLSGESNRLAPSHLRFLIGISLRGPQLGGDIIAVSAAKVLKLVLN